MARIVLNRPVNTATARARAIEVSSPVAANVARGARFLAPSGTHRHGSGKSVTGPKLQNSIYETQRITAKSVIWRIGSPLDYAETVSRGSRAHTIRAKNHKFMVFKWDRGSLSPRLRRRKWKGKFLFRKVYHPGNKRPRRFLTTPLAMYGRRGNFKVTHVGVTRTFLP